MGLRRRGQAPSSEHPHCWWVGQAGALTERERQSTQAAPTVHTEQGGHGGKARGAKERGPRRPGGVGRQMPPRPSRGQAPGDLDPHLPAEGPGLDPQSGTQTPCATAAGRAPTAKTWPGLSLKTGEGSGNAGEPGVTSGRVAQAGMAVAWPGCAGGPRTGWRLLTPGARAAGAQHRGPGETGPSLHTPSVSSCSLTEVLMPGKSPLTPGHTPCGGHPKILLVFPAVTPLH